MKRVVVCDPTTNLFIGLLRSKASTILHTVRCFIIQTSHKWRSLFGLKNSDHSLSCPLCSFRLHLRLC